MPTLHAHTLKQPPLLTARRNEKKEDGNEKNEMVFFECFSSKTSERLTFSQLSTEHHEAFSTTQSLVVSACETAACFGFPAASCFAKPSHLVWSLAIESFLVLLALVDDRDGGSVKMHAHKY